MIIYKCDFCEKDFQPYFIEGQKLFANFNYYEMSSVLTKGQPQPQLKMASSMLCSECGKKVNENIIELKKDYEKIETKTGELPIEKN